MFPAAAEVDGIRWWIGSRSGRSGSIRHVRAPVVSGCEWDAYHREIQTYWVSSVAHCCGAPRRSAGCCCGDARPPAVACCCAAARPPEGACHCAAARRQRGVWEKVNGYDPEYASASVNGGGGCCNACERGRWKLLLQAPAGWERDWVRWGRSKVYVRQKQGISFLCVQLDYLIRTHPELFGYLPNVISLVQKNVWESVVSQPTTQS